MNLRSGLLVLIGIALIGARTARARAPIEPIRCADALGCCSAWLETAGGRGAASRRWGSARVEAFGVPLQRSGVFWHDVAWGGVVVVAGVLAWIVRKRMADQARELESAVRMRTAELHEAKVQAEAANQAKTEFIAEVSHELRNPLGSILGLTDLSLEGPLPESVRRDLLLSRDCAEHLLDLINGLLDVAKIEAGKFEPERSAFDLEPWLAGLLKVQAHHARNKGLELSCRVAPGVPRRVVGDARRLRQVLINLVGNAIKFTDRGEVEVRVEDSGMATCSEATLQIAVRDTGVGIPEDRRAEIFLPFRRGVDPASGRREGTGLGLSISSRLVRLMGGVFDLETQSGLGSTFRFTARLGIAPEGPARVDLFWPGRRALVVAPNPTSRGHWAEHLRRRGLLTTEAGSVAEALMIAIDADPTFEASPYDVLVLDCDAREVAAGAGDLEQILPGVPLIRIESLGGGRVAPVGCSALEFPLTKPVLPGEMDLALARVFSSAVAIEEVEGCGLGGAGALGGRAARVLVADDDPVNRFMFERLLREHGYEVTVVSDGRQALRTLEENHPFDLAVLDGSMPGLCGTDVIARWRLHERDREVGPEARLRALAVTAAAMQGDRERILASGFDAYCPKPVRPREFLDAIESLLSVAPAPSPIFAEVGSGSLGAACDPSPLPLRLGDREGYHHAAGLFLEYTSMRWDRVREAIRDGDLAVARNVIHQIRGTLAYFGPPDIVSALDGLEEAAMRRDPGDLRDRFEALTPALRGLLDRIHEETAVQA